MKIIAISVLLCLTLLSCGSPAKSLWQEREIVFYVESKPVNSAAIANSEADGFKKAYLEILSRMESLGLIRDDLGEAGNDLDLLKSGLKSGKSQGMDLKLDSVKKKLDSIRVDADFIVVKDQKVRAALAKIQPKGEQLNKIESKLVRAEQLKQEQKFTEVNKIYSSILKILGY